MADTVLAAVGVEEDEEQAYRLILQRGAVAVRQVMEVTEWTQRRAKEVLAALESKGLVSRDPEKQRLFVAAPPLLAVEALILRRQRELEEARRAADDLQTMFQRAREADRPREHVEVVRGREAVGQRFVQLQQSAKAEVLGLIKPPYVDPSGPNEVELEMLGRGVRFRAIYDTTALEEPGMLEETQVVIDAGEEARTMGDVPMKMALADHHMALIPLELEEPGTGALIVHPSMLLEALRTLFDSLWERAVPIGTERGAEAAAAPDDREREIISLLAAGLKDQAIARALGLSHRTVQRRIGAILQDLGAQTRFQGGIQARDRGWVSGS